MSQVLFPQTLAKFELNHVKFSCYFLLLFCLGIASFLYNDFIFLQVSSYCQVAQTSILGVIIGIIVLICYNTLPLFALFSAYEGLDTVKNKQIKILQLKSFVDKIFYIQNNGLCHVCCMLYCASQSYANSFVSSFSCSFPYLHFPSSYMFCFDM